LARLGSGSACRSFIMDLLYGEILKSKRKFRSVCSTISKYEIHEIFKNFNDWVLLIHEGQKSVSSTVGHGLMNTNPYAERRFQEARKTLFR
jgi:diphosphomevalonate decarboxylase